MTTLPVILVVILSLQDTVRAADPVWVNPSASDNSAQVLETADVGTTVYTLVATDDDGDQLSYRIVGGSSVFSIADDVKLVTSVTLDYDSTQSYTLQFSVTDTNTAVESVTFTVNVQDVNDEPPLFSPKEYTVNNFKDDAAVNDEVVALVVTDGDETPAFRILTYSIEGGDALDQFQVEDDATVTVKATLNFDTTSTYTLLVKAEDSAGNSDTATVTINLIKSTSPTFSAPPADGVTETIPESFGDGETVFTVVVSDLDGDQLTVTIQSQTPDTGMFEMNGLNLDKTSAAPFNFEGTDTSYAVVFLVSDGGNDVISGTLTVSLTNVNEAPEFAETKYTRTVLDTDSSASVITLAASDPDNGDSVTYSFVSGNDDNKFAIDGSSGEITTQATFDYETKNQYVLVAKAVDNGGLEASSTVTVNVRTEPALTSPGSNPTVDENSPKDTVLITIASTDVDGDPPTYTLEPELDHAQFAIINNNQLATADGSSFDFETKTSYSVKISVTDGLYTDTLTLTIDVNDLVDESPVFDPPTYTTSLKEQVGATANIVRVTTTDADDSDTVSYTKSGSTSSLFSIDNNGQISTVADLVYATTAVHKLTIVAEDSNSNTATSTVTVSVLEISEPVFQTPGASGVAVSISEDVDGGHTVFSGVLATDADGDTLTYSINPAVTGFSLVNNEILTVGSTPIFDRETKAQHIIKIIAVDQNTPPSTGTGTVTVNLDDVNDNSPVLPASYSFPALQKQPETVIGTVAATDADSSVDNNNVIQYLITAGNDDNKFSIDGTTGEVKATNLVYADGVQRTLTVQAKDRNGAADGRTDTTQVAVPVETRPIFDAPTANQVFTVNEGEPSETTITGVTVNDEDGDSLTVSVSPGSAFTLETVSGVEYNLQTSKVFDRESQSEPDVYTVNLEVHDSKYTSTLTLTVNIGDINDESPTFNPTTYTASVWEGEPPGTDVTTVIATDLDDTSPNNVISYFVVSGDDGLFAFNPVSSPILKTSGSLTYTAVPYVITIRATDGGNPANTHDATATVTLTSHPVFTKPVAGAIASVDENSPAGTKVSSSTATDADGNSLTYNIHSQSANLFRMNGQDLEVDTGVTIDYETLQSVDVVFRVNDGTNTVTSPTLTVNVIDKNDNPPEFPSTSYNAGIKVGVQEVRTVIHLTATDSDSSADDNNVISYTIDSGDPNNDFTISPTGLIATTAQGVDGSTSRYTLVVMATDGGTPTLSGTTNVVIDVLNPTNPIFTLPLAGGSIMPLPESTTAGSDVFTVAVNDADGDPIDLEIDLQVPNAKFVLNGYDLQVVNSGGVTNPLDFEMDSQYHIKFRATDPDGTIVRSGLLTIEISDVNDNAPVCSPKLYYKSLEEGSMSSVTVATLSVTDADSNANAALTYTIVAGNPNNEFVISANGEIKTNTNAILSYSSIPLYLIEVKVEDGGNPVLHDICSVFLRVTKINGSDRLSVSKLSLMFTLFLQILLYLYTLS